MQMNAHIWVFPFYDTIFKPPVIRVAVFYALILLSFPKSVKIAILPYFQYIVFVYIEHCRWLLARL